MTETPVVVVAESDPSRADRYAAWLDDDCVVRVVHDGPGALDAIDRDVDVVVLGRSLRDATEGDPLYALRERGIDVGVATIGEDDPSPGSVASTPDDTLVEPVSAADLRRTASVLAARRRYEHGIHDLFSLATERAAVETGEVAAETARDLDARIDALRDRLDATLDDLIDEAGFAAAYRAIDRDDERS